MPDERWFELLPVVTRTTWVSGVPSKATLVEIQPAGYISQVGQYLGSQYLARPAAHAWVLMRRAAHQDGIELIAYSAYRSHEHQMRLYRQWEQGTRKLRPSAPGYSRHESGRAVDVLRSHDDPDAGGPLHGKTDVWLEKHGANFGFFHPVPGELWHWEHQGFA